MKTLWISWVAACECTGSHHKSGKFDIGKSCSIFKYIEILGVIRCSLTNVKIKAQLQVKITNKSSYMLRTSSYLQFMSIYVLAPQKFWSRWDALLSNELKFNQLTNDASLFFYPPQLQDTNFRITNNLSRDATVTISKHSNFQYTVSEGITKSAFHFEIAISSAFGRSLYPTCQHKEKSKCIIRVIICGHPNGIDSEYQVQAY